MDTINNGGAIAIKGFNYQKSVVMLIAVLHFLDDDNFELSVETKDDIVVSTNLGTTYIQTKSNELSLSSIMYRPKGKDSILEKNIFNGVAANSTYKLVAPSFKGLEKELDKITGIVITQGARVYEYNEEAIKKITKKLSGISQDKIKKSKIAVTLFNEDQGEALSQIQSAMISKGISVDNGHGLISLDELSGQIDRRSAIIAKDDADFAKKKFTKKDLSAIFSHSRKLEHFERIIRKLGYNTARQNALKIKRISVAAVYDSPYSAAKKFIESLELMNLSEREVVDSALDATVFKGVDDEILREAIVIDAFSQVIYEEKYI